VSADADSDVDDPADHFNRRTLEGTLRLGLRSVRDVMGDHTIFLPIVIALTPRQFEKRITKDTQLVIEGFPRCGNTFALHALIVAERAAGREIQIKSHVHVPAQVKLAVKRGLPTLQVVREPVSCMASYLIAAPHVSVGRALRDYTHHHREVLPYAHGFVVADFREVTTDFGKVVDRINERFGTSFARFEHNDENVEAAFASLEATHLRVHKGTVKNLPRPSDERQPFKEWLIEQITSPEHADDLAAARAVYAELTTGLDLT
jgi:hypothetical protein